MKGTQSPESQESQPKSGIDIVMPSVNVLIASVAVLAMMYIGNGAKMELITTIDSKLDTVNNKIEDVNDKIDSLQGEFSKFRKKSNKDAVEVKREFFKLKNSLEDLEFRRSVSDDMAEE
jgi:hypothetical protein